MSVSLYMDVHVRRAVTEGLRLRSVDVLTAQEDGTTLLEDSELLNRATALGRVLFTQDKTFLAKESRASKTTILRGHCFRSPVGRDNRSVRKRLG